MKLEQWKAQPFNDMGQTAYAIAMESGKSIGFAYSEKDARLIAQAPALLAALKKLVNDYDRYNGEPEASLMDEARQVINANL